MTIKLEIGIKVSQPKPRELTLIQIIKIFHHYHKKSMS